MGSTPIPLADTLGVGAGDATITVQFVSFVCNFLLIFCQIMVDAPFIEGGGEGEGGVGCDYTFLLACRHGHRRPV